MTVQIIDVPEGTKPEVATISMAYKWGPRVFKIHHELTAQELAQCRSDSLHVAEIARNLWLEIRREQQALIDNA